MLVRSTRYGAHILLNPSSGTNSSWPAILWRNGSDRRHRLFELRSLVWHGKGRHWYHGSWRAEARQHGQEYETYILLIDPGLKFSGLIPTIMAGILSIYGLVVSIQIATNIYKPAGTPLAVSFIHFGAGLSVGLSALAAGFAIGIVGDAGVRAFAQQPRLFVAMVLIMIFAEVLGLYGMIVALLLLSGTSQAQGLCIA